jgi:hypothetical protein
VWWWIMNCNHHRMLPYNFYKLMTLVLSLDDMIRNSDIIIAVCVKKKYCNYFLLILTLLSLILWEGSTVVMFLCFARSMYTSNPSSHYIKYLIFLHNFSDSLAFGCMFYSVCNKFILNKIASWRLTVVQLSTSFSSE